MRDNSHLYTHLYICRTPSGKVLTVTEHVVRLVGPDQTPSIECPNCSDPVSYDEQRMQFVHDDPKHLCYTDRRETREHTQTQQAVYAELTDTVQYAFPEMKYQLHNNRYDVGSPLKIGPHDGIVIEIQHRTGCFHSRIKRKIRVTHRHNHRVHVVFTPTANGQPGFREYLQENVHPGAKLGGYDGKTVTLGASITTEGPR